MSTTEETKESKVLYEIVDHNSVPDSWVTYIVNIWDGPKNDPATNGTTYIGVWDGALLETEEQGAFDPDFTRYQEFGRYSYRSDAYKPAPKIWEALEVFQKPDREAINFRREYDSMSSQASGAYYYGSQAKQRDLYTKMLDGIDRIAQDDTDEQAWADVEAYRQYMALKHEK